MPRLRWLALPAALAACSACAQTAAPHSIGTVSTADASVSGMLQTTGDTATILSNGTVAAHDHTAVVALTRGGQVEVCSTSVVHLSQSTAADSALLVSLDRGALELSLHASADDALLTPDMRLQPAEPGPLDLRIRVVSNGDTCIENRGSSAPALMVADTFGESSYIIHAQQHVLFEHGSLRQVVDNENSPCGCPPPVQSVADSGVTGSSIAKPGSPAEQHPFPEAVSEGLAPAPAPPAAAPGQTHMQLGLTLAYNGSTPAAPVKDSTSSASPTAALNTAGTSVQQMTAPAAAAPSASPASPSTNPVIAQSPTKPPPPSDLAQAVVRLYRWLFHRHSRD